MTTTTEPPPMRPRGAARQAANAATAAAAAAAAGVVSHQATGVAATAPAAPVSTAPETTPRRTAGDVADTLRACRPVSEALPSRRELRAGPQRKRESRPTPRDVGRTVTRGITLPLRSISSAVASAKAVPVTATAVAACLFFTVATPQTAVAATPQAALPALDAQEYTVAAGSSIPVLRDSFAIGRVPIRMPASPPPSTSGGPTSVRPVAGTIPIAGGFGSRWVRGCASCSTNHQGLDFAAPTGTAVVAAMSGRVVSAGVFGGYGNQVLLQHADGSETRYGHLSQISVRAGQTVAVGERIGAVGNTGVSTGSHLHFEVILGGTPVDPATWLRNRGLL
ncbi:peptidoglycan DD-metalloendopeptidase family protein [Curtobacterium sp. MCPF17_002]|uniref:M23 family metallopeptidase n=1 Tax=Curtobacterium sp. MCPF17_002 TaxID=2175645 RepID=UPI001C648B19|nr:M23 family metallopeptidase [Curtobacterium sp. MCPF17_002]WIB78185.1 peptidoglycan DD-metalloendopeptidase family protein [Curtobacterium sp. MCPF17_002]